MELQQPAEILATEDRGSLHSMEVERMNLAIQN